MKNECNKISKKLFQHTQRHTSVANCVILYNNALIEGIARCSVCVNCNFVWHLFSIIMPRLYGIALVVFLKDMQGKVDMIGCKSVKCVFVCLCIFALHNIHKYIHIYIKCI